LIQRLADSTLPARLLIERLSLPEVDPIERQALLLAWAETRKGAVPRVLAAAWVQTASALYRDDPHPAVHSAAELVLFRLAGADFVGQREAELRGRATPAQILRWQLGPNGHTLAILPGPLEFRMGAAPYEQGHANNPTLHYRRINRSLAVATKEVTYDQFRKAEPHHTQSSRFGDEPGSTATYVSWFAAARYCNWLSEKDGIPRSEWCYPDTVKPGMVISAEAVKRQGYRLPTEAEWEYLCRAGTQTSRPYGDSQDLLSHYAWTWLNSQNRAHKTGELLPNEFGIFDVLGNVWEWCHDGPAGGFPEVPMPPYPQGTETDPAPDPARTEPIYADPHGTATWRILRGGAFPYAPERARSAYRDWHPPQEAREFVGFRVVRTLLPVDR
jgi:formylglycine-generating enzyme required for sulfatase activity